MTVYILGAGASIGSHPSGGSRLPATAGLMRLVREEARRHQARAPALACYLQRYAPRLAKAGHPDALHPEWDEVNVEELYAALEFETRITDHLTLPAGQSEDEAPFSLEYFSPAYRREVEALMSGPYADWCQSCYAAPWQSRAFPWLHANFIRVVRAELLSAIAFALGQVARLEDSPLLGDLVDRLENGDTIVTLNYDLLVEQHLLHRRPAEWSYLTGYRLRTVDQSTSLSFCGQARDVVSVFNVLKLHGSCNWHLGFVCGQGNSWEPGLALRAEPSGIGAGVLVPDFQPKSFLCTDGYHDLQPCNGSTLAFIERLIIPPTPYKAEQSFAADFVHMPDGKALGLSSAKLWIPQLLFREALRALREASTVVCVGYSFPAADSSMRMLIRSAADANPRLERLTVCDPIASVRGRVLSLFPNAQVRQEFPSLLEFLRHTT